MRGAVDRRAAMPSRFRLIPMMGLHAAMPLALWPQQNREQAGREENAHGCGGFGRRHGHIPEIPAAQCREAGRPPGHAPQGFWHLAKLDLACAARRSAQVRPRASGAGPRQGRPHCRHRRQPSASLLDICGSAIARRRSRAGLCRRCRRRDGLCARPCRRAFRNGAGPGAGRQDKVVRRQGSRPYRRHL